MLVSQSDIFDVPAAQATVLTIREVASRQRTLFFENLTTADTLTILVEYSTDGGSTWMMAVTSFDLDPGEIEVKNVLAAYTGILRVRASGGGEDRDLSIGYSRTFGHTVTWTNPIL